MNFKKVLFLNNHFCKCFCTSSVRVSKSREAHFFNKIMAKGNKRNKNDGFEHYFTHHEPASKYKKKVTNNPGRVTVLNKLFMKHVTDHISMLSGTEQLEGKGFEITDVCVSRDLKLLSVYWFARKNLVEIDQFLKKSAGVIRHELTQLKLMGVVPPIRFVKNASYSHALRVEELLSQVNLYSDDEGEVCSEEEEEEEEESRLYKKPIMQENENTTEGHKDHLYNVVVPEMTHSIFNLHHATMMSKIRTDMKRCDKSKVQLKRQSEILSQLSIDTTSTNDTQPTNDPKLLTTYLKKRALSIKRKEISSLELLLKHNQQEEEQYKAYRNDLQEDIDDYPVFSKF